MTIFKRDHPTWLIDGYYWKMGSAHDQLELHRAYFAGELPPFWFRYEDEILLVPDHEANLKHGIYGSIKDTYDRALG